MQMKNVEDIYPLSPTQQGLLFHTLYAPDSGIYTEQVGMTFQGAFNAVQFQQAWQMVVNHHAILRTAFLWEGLEEPLQVVREHVTLTWEERDWQDLAPDEQEARLAAFMAEDRIHGFALNHAPLLRLVLLRVAPDRVHFIWSYHHLLLDGTSTNLILTQVFAAYDALQRGQTPAFPTPRPFKEYIAWLQVQDLAGAEAFWRRQLAGFTAPTPLVVDRLASDSSPESDVIGELEIHLSPETTAALQQFARQQQVTLSTIIQGAWALLLSRYSDAEDVVFGITVSTRPPTLPGAETMVGIFINTLPLRVRLPMAEPVADWLREVQTAQVETRHYDFSPLVDVQSWSEVPRGRPLFESLLVFENYATEASEHATNDDDQTITRTWWGAEKATYPLTLTVAQGPELLLRFGYEPQRLAAPTIARMAGHLRTIIESMLAQPTSPLRAVALLTEPERHQLLTEWNPPPDPHAGEGCLHELFAAQVRQTPDALALQFGEQRLTYAELDGRANQIAQYVQARGVGPDQLVGLCMDRSFDLISGLLGILKAGGAYLPLDPAYPAERLAYMLRDAGTRLVLTSQAQQPLVAAVVATLDTPPQVVVLDAEDEQIAQQPQSAPQTTVRPDHLAYSIYTSGSTGRPKGVLVTHRGTGNLAREQARAFGVTPGSRVLQFASPSFDAAVSEITSTLLSGATLCLADDHQLHFPPDLLALLRDQQINVVTLPPSLVAVLPAADLPELHTLVVAGEACQPEWLARWAAPERRLINAYGPSEATVCATLAAWDATGPLTIGRAIANVTAYVLDAQQRLVPIGVPGELCIGGVGLARGYATRADLTSERFIPHPFTDQAVGARLYRTGDVVCWLPDGRLLFVGRQDAQVKLRGFRIELGEIEAVLNEHPDVQTAVVLVWDGETADTTDKQLVAYVVARPNAAPTAHDLYAFLQQRVPAYMIPAAFVAVAALPIDPNGKLDRRALPSPFAERMEANDDFVAPRNRVEADLAKIWADVLGLDRVSVQDNFFELGGHSLLATQVTSRIRETFDIELPIWTIFETLTIAGLAQAIIQQEIASADSTALAEAMQELD